MKEKKVIVSLKGISKTYDNDVKVVKNIDLDIYEGEYSWSFWLRQNHHAAYDSWL